MQVGTALVPLPAQRRANIDQAAHSCAQLSCEHLQGWRFHNFSSSHSWCLTTLMVKTTPDLIGISHMAAWVSIASCPMTVHLQENSAPARHIFLPICYHWVAEAPLA